MSSSGFFTTTFITHGETTITEHEKTIRGVNPIMDANVKHFEMELLARAEEEARRTAQLSPKANVVTATAL